MRTRLAILIVCMASGIPAIAQSADALTAHDSTASPLSSTVGSSVVPVSLTIRRVVPEVQMVFSLEDRRGRPVSVLNSAEFEVLDNGVSVPLTFFRPAVNLPLRLALLLDTSDSMRAQFAAERSAALDFVRSLAHSTQAQVLPLAFAAGELTGAGNAALPAASLAARQPGGQTALYDALIAASRALDSGPQPARRMILLFSDGEDNYSRASLAEAITQLQQSDIAVYAFSVHSSRLQYPGDRVLQQIAAATGGRAFILCSFHRGARVFAEIATGLRSQYVLGFRPAGPFSGEFHRVTIVAPHGMRTRARAGYYAPPTR